MNNGLIIDAVFALVLALGVLLGAKRGLVRSLMGLVTVVAALIGAAILSDLLAEPVTEVLLPWAEESVVEWLGGEGAPPAALDGAASESSAPAGDAAAIDATGILRGLLRIDKDGALHDSLRALAQEAALAAARSLMGSLVRTVLFLLAFLLLTLLLRLLARGIDKVFSLPVLHTINSLGGALLGLAESALLLFLVCDVAPRLGVTAFSQYEAGTYLLAFFMQQSPRSIAAALLPRS